MILSMTGAGKATAQFKGKNISIFVKTLNSKQIDISTRIASCYREREIELRSILSELLVRGKVELSIAIDSPEGELSGVHGVNEEALRYYVDTLSTIYKTVGLDMPSSDSLLRLPGVLVPQGDKIVEELTEEEWLVLREGMNEAINAVVVFRTQEGRMLEGVLRQRIERIASLLSKIDQPESERIEQIRERIEDALSKINPTGYDKGRLEQEMIYYIEKLDINEEKDRLRHHLNYFMEVLEEGQNQGKTLGFIAQEIGREINTLGSKSNNAEMQQLVVQMKDELEQIKEQVLNVL